MRIALRVEVNSLRGLREGVPRLMGLFNEFQVRASFFFPMGPDDAVLPAQFVQAKKVIPCHYNTWPPIEQDADVVMFVFREEYYREREKPGDHDLEGMAKWQQIMEQVHGKAEVIIGKQRHGPIGTVELSFEGQFTDGSRIFATQIPG